MAKTISELRNQSIQVRDASAAGENTATRVGTVLNDIVDHIEDYENTQSSNNSSQDAKIEGVKSSLNAEIARAKTEESNLTTQIDTERTERQAAVSREETARIQADNDEKTARQQADNAEQDARIKADNDEKTARENADITLRTMIQTEVSNRQIAVKQEEIRAMAAEQANAQAIADEVARATTAEAAETARAKAEEERLQGEIDNTNTNVETLDNKVNSNHDYLTGEVARLDTTDIEIKADLETETARATAAEEANAQAITDEKNRAMAAEQAIIFDVTAYNNGAVFESLIALLSSPNLSILIPTSFRHGGMTIRFIQGSEQSSDNKYVQYRLMLSEFTTAKFTNADNWQGVDDEPTIGSNNLVKSGGVADKVAELEGKVDNIISDGTLNLTSLEWKAGYYNDTSEKIISSDTRVYSDILLKGGTKYIIENNINNRKIEVIWYDENKQWVSCSWFSNKTEIDATSNAYFKISVDGVNTDTIKNETISLYSSANKGVIPNMEDADRLIAAWTNTPKFVIGSEDTYDGNIYGDRRVVFANGFSIPVKAGDIIGLKDYSSFRYAFRVKTPSGEIRHHYWTQQDIVFDEYEGDCRVIIATVDDSIVQKDVSTLGSLLFIKSKDLNPQIEVLESDVKSLKDKTSGLETSVEELNEFVKDNSTEEEYNERVTKHFTTVAKNTNLDVFPQFIPMTARHCIDKIFEFEIGDSVIVNVPSGFDFAIVQSSSNIAVENWKDSGWKTSGTSILIERKYACVSVRKNDNSDISVDDKAILDAGLTITYNYVGRRKVVKQNTDISVYAMQNFIHRNTLTIANHAQHNMAKVDPNTAFATKLAAMHGYTCVENDVRATTDGVFVLAHDDDMSTYFVNNDGSAITPNTAFVTRKTYSDLYNNYKYKDGYSRITTLEEQLSICKAEKLNLLCELKDFNDATKANECVDLCKEYLGYENFVLASFNENLLDEIRMTDKQVTLMYIAYRNSYKPSIDKLAKSKGNSIIDIDYEAYATQGDPYGYESYISEAVKNGVPMGVWTINFYDAINVAKDARFKLITTNTVISNPKGRIVKQYCGTSNAFASTDDVVITGGNVSGNILNLPIGAKIEATFTEKNLGSVEFDFFISGRFKITDSLGYSKYGSNEYEGGAYNFATQIGTSWTSGGKWALKVTFEALEDCKVYAFNFTGRDVL